MKYINKSVSFHLILSGILFVLLFSNTFLQAREANEKRSPLEMRYIANSGVMLSVGGEKILVDALFNRPNPEYMAPSKEDQEKMLAGQAPFDEMTLVLITHDHPDHFNGEMAARYMENNKKTILIAPADVVSIIKEKTKAPEQIQSRLIAFNLEVGETAQQKVNDISIQTIRTQHSGNREVPANLMFVIEMKGWRIFHEGDSNENEDDFKKLLKDKQFDLALVHYWFPFEERGTNLLKEVIKTDHIALFHLPIRLEKETSQEMAKIQNQYKDIILFLPGMEPVVYK